MKPEKISINGIIKKPDDALVLATNLSLSSGIGVFETFRVSEDKVFLLDEHFARLQKSLKALGLHGIDENEARKNILKIAKLAKPDHDAFVRLAVTGANGGLASFKIDPGPMTIIYMCSITKLAPTDVRAKTLSGVKRHKPEYFDITGFRLKSLDYSHAFFAQSELEDNEMGIMLSPEGYAAEALNSNIFWVEESKIYTPPLELGILPGVIRKFLINNFNVDEKKALKDEILEADEIFLTNSVKYLTPVKIIDGIEKPGTKGQVFLNLYDQISKSIKT